MDSLVAACEKSGIGLVPTIFWNPWEIPFEFNEFRSAWLDEDSETRHFVRQYTSEFVSRYRNRQSVWLWEFANEDNLDWDLPNAISLLPEARKDNRNIVRSTMGILAERLFARQVRSVDAVRPISSGTSEVRANQFRLASVPLKPGEPWGVDTPQQASEATAWMAPAPVDLLSVHHYEPPDAYDPATVRSWLQTAGQHAQALKVPLFLGEFGVMTRWINTPDNLDDEAYRKSVSDYFQAIFESRTALAAYWAFTPNSRQVIGSVGPDYHRFDFIFELIAEYNRKCSQIQP